MKLYYSNNDVYHFVFLLMTECVIGYSLLIISVDRTLFHHVFSCQGLTWFVARVLQLPQFIQCLFAKLFSRRGFIAQIVVALSLANDVNGKVTPICNITL